jgi:hypothetical protein
VRNPLRSEDEAFRFLIAALVAALVIAVAAYVNTWLGVAAAVVAVGGLVWWLREEPLPGVADAPQKLTSSSPTGMHRVLVVALPGTESVKLADGVGEVMVVVPAVSSRVQALTGDVDGRRAEAERTAAALAARIPNARAEVGADDPALAVDDALRTFGADEIVVVGDEELVDQVRGRVTIPVSRA